MPSQNPTLTLETPTPESRKALLATMVHKQEAFTHSENHGDIPPAYAERKRDILDELIELIRDVDPAEEEITITFPDEEAQFLFDTAVEDAVAFYYYASSEGDDIVSHPSQEFDLEPSTSERLHAWEEASHENLPDTRSFDSAPPSERPSR